MTVLRYPVTQNFIPNLPQIPYRNGVGAWEGVVMHYTDNPSDTSQGERDYEAQTFQQAFVHEFVDPTEALQVADPNYIAYGAGQFANQRFVHIELCHADDQEGFDKSFDRWCERAAEYLFARHLGVTAAQADGNGTLWSHYDVTQFLGGTTHTDPIEYLQKWGKTWQDVIDRVTACYNDLASGNIWQPPQSGTTTTEPPAPDPWKTEAIQWLKDQKLIEDDHDPDAPVTWAQLAVVLQRNKKGE